MNRRVLVLTHGFLPWAGANAERVASLCEHLPSFGWEPLILCASIDSFHPFDEPRAAEFWRNWVCERVGDHATWPVYRAAEAGGMVRPFRGLLTLATGFPDIYRCWAEQCKAVAERMFLKCQPALVFSTSPPHSIHLVGRRLKERFGIPWIMDLRDAWRGHRTARYLTPFHRAMADRQYQQCVGRADRIIANTDRLAHMITGHVGGRADRVHVVTNGYDEGLFAAATPRALVVDGAKAIVYAGATYEGFVESTFQEVGRALERLEVRDHVRLMIVGESQGVSASSRFGPVSVGYESRAEVPAILMGAEVLVLVMPAPSKEAGSARVTLKTYGYLRSGRPIVYIGPEGAAWDLISRFGGTYKFDPGAWDAIGRKLQALCRSREDWTQERLPALQAFSWRNLTGKLAGVFDSVM